MQPTIAKTFTVQTIWVDKELQVRGNKVKDEKRENRLKRDEPQTIEKSLKLIMKITCLQLTAQDKEAIQEVVQPDNSITHRSSSSSNSSTCHRVCRNRCHSSLIKLISIRSLNNSKIRILDNMDFHLEIMDSEINRLLKFTSSLKSSSSLRRFLQINS